MGKHSAFKSGLELVLMLVSERADTQGS